MSRTVVQKVTLKASPKKLYNAYLNSTQHSKIIGTKAKIKKKVGGSFAAFGMLKGKILKLIPNKTIVQTWRSKGWKKSDTDSILVLNFKKVRGGGQISLVHVNVPQHDYAAIQKGWKNYYWKPWKKYLSKN